MNRIALLLLAAILPVSIAACTSMAAPSPEARAAIQRGQALAERHCAQCHAIGRTGDSPVPSAPRWREMVMVGDIDDIAESFAEGSFIHSQGPVQMPEFIFAPAEIEDLLAYMRALRPA